MKVPVLRLLYSLAHYVGTDTFAVEFSSRSQLPRKTDKQCLTGKTLRPDIHLLEKIINNEIPRAPLEFCIEQLFAVDNKCSEWNA